MFDCKTYDGLLNVPAGAARSGRGRMKTLLIVYYSRIGGTRQMAEAAARGAAAEPGVDVRLLQATAAGPGDVLAADGYIFAAPENLAALAELMTSTAATIRSSAGSTGGLTAS